MKTEKLWEGPKSLHRERAHSIPRSEAKFDSLLLKGNNGNLKTTDMNYVLKENVKNISQE